jgi:hypothetical protein
MKKSIYIQKKAFNIKACMIIIGAMFLFISCKPLRIIPHTETGTDNYCVYKIGSVMNSGAMQALKKGDVICLYCPGAYHCILNNKRWVKMYLLIGDHIPGHIMILKDTGISYLLDSDNPSASCSSCPGTNKFELY